MKEKIKNIRGYSALIIITILACFFSLIRGLFIIMDLTSRFILIVFAIPFMLIAFLLEPEMTKSSVKDLIKIASMNIKTKQEK